MSDKSSSTKELWEFGEFRLDARARLLLRDGIPVPLTPKALEVLLHLARNSGRAVSREELFDAVWPDTIVTDASLTQAVFLVRKALGETDASSFVETVPRIGYRLNLPGPTLRRETEAEAEGRPVPAAVPAEGPETGEPTTSSSATRSPGSPASRCASLHSAAFSRAARRLA